MWPLAAMVYSWKITFLCLNVLLFNLRYIFFPMAFLGKFTDLEMGIAMVLSSRTPFMDEFLWS